MGRSVKEESKCPSAPGQLPEPRDAQPQDYSPRPYPAVSTADSSRSGGQHRGQFPVRRSAPRTAPRSAVSTADSSCGCITVAPWRPSPRRPVPLLQRCLLHAPSTSPHPCHQASFPCHTACSLPDIVLPVSPTHTTRCLVCTRPSLHGLPIPTAPLYAHSTLPPICSPPCPLPVFHWMCTICVFLAHTPLCPTAHLSPCPTAWVPHAPWHAYHYAPLQAHLCAPLHRRLVSPAHASPCPIIQANHCTRTSVSHWTCTSCPIARATPAP